MSLIFGQYGKNYSTRQYPLDTDFVTFPIEEATGYTDTSSSAWQGVAQIFKLNVQSYKNFGATCILAFDLGTTSLKGLTYRVGLYKQTTNDRAICIAKSSKLTTEGGRSGPCFVRITGEDGDIILSPDDSFYTVFTISQYNTGAISLATKSISGWPSPAQHITYPAGFSADKPDSDWAEVGFGSWSSSMNVWFGIDMDRGFEVLP